MTLPVKVAMPRVADIYAPHEFHGTREEVMVPASSRVLESILGASPASSKAGLNSLPGSTVAIFSKVRT